MVQRDKQGDRLRLPVDIYQYLDFSLMIVGDAPTNPMAIQTGLTSVQVSWTAPHVPPANGYCVSATPSTGSATVISSPATITVSTPGVYTFNVMSQSQHLPGMTASTQEVTV